MPIDADCLETNQQNENSRNLRTEIETLYERVKCKEARHLERARVKIERHVVVLLLHRSTSLSLSLYIYIYIYQCLSMQTL
jgi:hypothetical protein